MKSKFETFLDNLSDSSDKLKNMPLVTAKYHVMKEVYNFLIFAEEIKSNSYVAYPNDRNNREFVSLVPSLNIYLKELKDFIVSINSCENVADIRTSLQTFIDSTLFRFLGWITVNKGLLPSAYYSTEFYAFREYADEKTFPDCNDCSCLNDLMARAFSTIETNRQYLNIYCRQSYTTDTSYRSNPDDNFWEYMLRCSIAFSSTTNRYSPKFYMYCQSSESNLKIAQYGIHHFEKAIYGDSGAVRVSSMFDVGFTAIRSLYGFINQTDQDFRLLKASCNALFTHIRKGGIAMVMLPEAFLYHSVLYYLCSRLEKVSFVREDNAPGLVIVMGIVRDRSVLTLDDTCTAMCDNITDESGYTYTITAPAPESIMFRAAVPNIADIYGFLEKDNGGMLKALRPVYNKIRLETTEKAVRPAMLFSPGQLGLVLTSGRIDGVVDEGNGHYHVIKGSVVKNPVTSESFEEDGTRVVNTITGNTTSVTMLTADGEFKDLK